jgi:phospholipid/cholesterol/gamma-HCH transport system ATP-binding protein
MGKVIEITGLIKSFGQNHVLRNVDLVLHKGENIAILGRSGIGKSVLAKCIIRLIEPDEGEVIVLNEDVRGLSLEKLNILRRRIGYLFQSGAAYDSMTVKENLEFPLRRTQQVMSKDDVNDLIIEAVENVGLEDALDKFPSELSGGMRKRLGLARTLILKPDIILYDEPTTGLDPVTSLEISELMLKIQERYKTSSIIITHDIKCAKMTANNVKLLREGKFYAEGTFDMMQNSKDKIVSNYFS